MTLRSPDLLGVFHFWPLPDRTRRVVSGYRPGHRLYDNYISSGTHHYLETDHVESGGLAQVQVTFITPQAYPGCLWVGRKIDVCEGERAVGLLTIVEVLNPLLLGLAEDYQPIWKAPT